MITVDPTNSAGLQTVLDTVGVGLSDFEVYLNPGTYDIDNGLLINSGTKITGNNGTILRLVDNATLSQYEPVIGQSGASIEDIFIENIEFDGNDLYQTVSIGQGYHDFLKFDSGKNIYINNINIHDSKGDAFNLINSESFLLENSIINKCGNDAVYAKYTDGVEIRKNRINMRGNCGIELNNCNNININMNTIKGYDNVEAGNEAIKIFHSGDATEDNIPTNDVEICNNFIYQGYSAGILLSNTGIYSSSTDLFRNVRIHHNIIKECGLKSSVDVGGIICSGYDAVLIEHNDIVDCYRFGILVRGSPTGTEYILAIYNNNIIGTQLGRIDNLEGIGASNELNTTHFVFCAYNNFYDNAGGSCSNITSENGISADPLFFDPLHNDYHLKSISGRYLYGLWFNDTVQSPCIDAGNPTDSYYLEPEPNNNRCNIGRYGNTVQASKSIVNHLFVEIGE